MGQQQLLLIVLGVIIVGIAVVVGINVFTASSASANRDAVISDLTNLAAMAQQYYRKPGALGGGGNKFDGWTVPPQLVKTPNMSANVTVSGATGDGPLILTGTGTETGNNGTTPVQVRMNVLPSRIDSTIIVN